MNKRGQIYILAAIIICMLAFLVVAKSNTIREQVLLQNFEGISNNYLTEGPKVVNEAIEEGGDIKGSLNRFTQSFIEDYARNQDPKVGLIYIYNDNERTIIKNELNGEEVYFGRSLTGDIDVILPGNEQLTGDIIFVDSGVSENVKSNLCSKEQLSEKYCEFNTGATTGPVTLKIGETSYSFELTAESPELIVIVKSQDEDTVKVDVSEGLI